MSNRIRKLLLALPGFQAFCRLLTRRRVRALMYHRFRSGANGNPRWPDAACLRWQAALIARHHTVWSPDDHLAALRGEPTPPGRCPVVITTDDGYLDFHEVALPVFREHGLASTLFVVTGFVDGDVWMWWDRLEYICRHAPAGRPTVDVAGKTLTLDLTSAAGRRAAWNDLADRCRFLPNAVKLEALGALERALRAPVPASPPPEYRAMSWEQLREAAGQRVSLGAHTVSHPILSRLEPAEARAEIVGSRDRLAAATGVAPTWFCYPQGGPADFDATVQALVRDAGFRGSYLAYQDLEREGDPYAMSRTCVSDDRTAFAWTLCGAEHLMLRLRQRLGRPVRPGTDYWAGAE